MSDDNPTLHLREANGASIFRVGFRPDPWMWSPWEYAPFTGRWDDPQGQYRVLYTGTSALACYVEVLAHFRPDVVAEVTMAGISGDVLDASYPTLAFGIIPKAWAEPRLLGEGTIDGSYVDIQHVVSISQLRPLFIKQAMSLGLSDFDGATIRLAEPRSLTRAISRHLYAGIQPPVDGVHFDSRHGNGLGLFAVFERPSSVDAISGSSALVNVVHSDPVPIESRDFEQALLIHNLRLEEFDVDDGLYG